jgi:hypothetical protein
VPAPAWLKHAFALGPSEATAPNETQRAVVERLAHEIVRRHLTAPALLTLEACSPLNFVSAQALYYFQPFVSSFTDARAYDEFARFVEQRGSVDYIRDRIEAVERDYAAGERAGTS